MSRVISHVFCVTCDKSRVISHVFCGLSQGAHNYDLDVLLEITFVSKDVTTTIALLWCSILQLSFELDKKQNSFDCV